MSTCDSGCILTHSSLLLLDLIIRLIFRHGLNPNIIPVITIAIAISATFNAVCAAAFAAVGMARQFGS
ncbi:unnamed protein product [Taenia asiatica]|uniref:Transmembrane protein n=1 Tax=Taenia asiatica TaxID=60517 RepID=A0A0R3VX92_TAEAS|nr:unnamed protein product [Taenia asiatica]